MKTDVTITVNGTTVEATVPTRMLLVHFIRDQAGLTGTHVGCDTSNCGACTVLLDGRSVKACTVLAAQADGAEVTTIEALGTDRRFSPVQEGFRQCHGLQCGYCTPGMIVAATDLLAHNPDPDEAEIREGIAGNLCRCTGYQGIVEAVQWAARHNTGAEQPAAPHADGHAGDAELAPPYSGSTTAP